MQDRSILFGAALLLTLGTACKSTTDDHGAPPAPTSAPATTKPVVPAVVTATAAPSVDAASADYSELGGGWGFQTDWGQVIINGRTGSYTDTFGPGNGKLEFTKTGEHTYTVVWAEAKARHGTMSLTCSDDGRRLRGTWTPDANVTIGTKTGGSIYWVRR